MSRRFILSAVLTLACAASVAAFFWQARPTPALADAPSIEPIDTTRSSAKEVPTPATTPVEWPAPEFPGKAEWAQGGPIRLADLHGKVTVVHFWTNGCINCIRNYPAYRAWQKKYADKDVTLIGVHTPEFASEAPIEVVRAKASQNGLTFPIVLDPGNVIWSAWNTRYWPTVFLVDKRGGVRYWWEGELHLDTADGVRFAARIDELLGEK